MITKLLRCSLYVSIKNQLFGFWQKKRKQIRIRRRRRLRYEWFNCYGIPQILRAFLKLSNVSFVHAKNPLKLNNGKMSVLYSINALTNRSKAHINILIFIVFVDSRDYGFIRLYYARCRTLRLWDRFQKDIVWLDHRMFNKFLWCEIFSSPFWWDDLWCNICNWICCFCCTDHRIFSMYFFVIIFWTFRRWIRFLVTFGCNIRRRWRW